MTEICRRAGAVLGKYGYEVEDEMPIDELLWWARQFGVNITRPMVKARGLTGKVDADAFLRRLQAQGMTGELEL